MITGHRNGRGYPSGIRAIDPNFIELLSADGDVARTFGRFEIAITKYRAVLTRDPLNPDAWSNLASAQQAAGQLQESIESSRRVLELSPAYAGEHADMAITLLRAGRIDEAMSAANEEPDASSRLTALSVLQWAVGDTRASNETLRDLTQKHSADAPVSIAGAYSFRGEATTAFSWLERAYKQHDENLTLIGFNPLLTNLHDDLELPRFRGQVVVLVCDSRLLDVHRSYQQCSLPPQAAEALRFS